MVVVNELDEDPCWSQASAVGVRVCVAIESFEGSLSHFTLQLCLRTVSMNDHDGIVVVAFIPCAHTISRWWTTSSRKAPNIPQIDSWKKNNNNILIRRKRVPPGPARPV